MPDYHKVQKAVFLYTIYKTSVVTATHFSHTFPATSTLDSWHHY